MKIAKEIWIGLAFIVALALFIWGINFLKGSSIFGSQRYFYAVYDRVDGLTSSNPVTVNGLKIGQVGYIGFMEDGSSRILVEMMIDDPIAIPQNSVATIISSDLLGSKEVSIGLGDANEYCNTGDTLTSDIQKTLQEEVNRQVAPLKRKAEDLMLSIDSMVTVISLVFNENMRASLEGSIGNIQQTIENLKNTTSTIDTLVTTERTRMSAIIGNIESITNNLKQNNEVISDILTNLGSISDSLSKADIANTFIKANSVLEDVEAVTAKINRGEGTVGLLLEDDKLYYRLENSATDLDLLLQDVRLNPQRYINFSVFGKNPNRMETTPLDSTVRRGD